MTEVDHEDCRGGSVCIDNGNASGNVDDNGNDNNKNDNNAATDLSNLSNADLISRVTALESQLKATTEQLKALTNTTSQQSFEIENQSSQGSKALKKPPKPFDPSAYSTRHIALKFSYIGSNYNGFEHTNNSTSAPAKPTIEEVLWKALRKSRLISPVIPQGADQSYEVVWDEKERAARYGVGTHGLGRGKKGRERLELVWDGLEYSKCGRTDKGVSAFGQVIGIRVRSSKPVVKRRNKSIEMRSTEPEVLDGSKAEHLSGSALDSPAADIVSGAGTETFSDILTVPEEAHNELYADNAANGWHSTRDELAYISILNGVLPPSIRILAWCPHPPPSFDARFSCKERRYKYFFTNPAMFPNQGTPGVRRPNESDTAMVRDGWLDIEAMREAAKKLEGLHDYRNFCKIDASKQMSSCERRVTYADIEEFSGGLDGVFRDAKLSQAGSGSGDILQRLMDHTVGKASAPKVYAFAVHGTAFLWHQVRCMVAVLFLVGQGLESPEIVDRLLDIKETPGKPHYEMADDAPLVLWDCAFPGESPEEENTMEWVYAGETVSETTTTGKNAVKFSSGGLIDQLWAQWREAKMQETLAAGLLGLALRQGTETQLGQADESNVSNHAIKSQRVFDGSPAPRSVGLYVPVMQRPQMETLNVQNAKYAAGKQSRRDLKKAQGSTRESS